MRTNTSSGSHSSHESTMGMNMAQRLRGMLGIRAARGRAPVRQRRLQLEAMEPRFLLSGEALVIPPLVKATEDAQGVISMPAQLLQTQLASSMTGQLMDVAVRPTIEAQTRAHEVIFVDPAVEAYDALVSQALRKRGGPDAAPINVEVVVLDAASDGVTQISQWLAQRRDLQAIHLVSHGNAGVLQLGTTTLDGQSIDGYSAALTGWRTALADGADLLVYGCDVAEGTKGADFVVRLATLTGADVAASTNATGSAAQGGDWQLEMATGRIEAPNLFTGAAYSALLQLDASTLTLNAGLQTQVKAVLNKVDATVNEALKNNLINSGLPGLGDSANKLIGLTTTNGGTSGVMSLELSASNYFVANPTTGTLS